MDFATIAPDLAREFSETQITNQLVKMSPPVEAVPEPDPDGAQITIVFQAWKQQFKNVNGLRVLARNAGVSVDKCKSLITQMKAVKAKWLAEQEPVE